MVKSGGGLVLQLFFNTREHGEVPSKSASSHAQQFS
jgi:hypothetical protein